MMSKGKILHDLFGVERARVRPEDLLARFDEVRRREQLDAPVAEMLRQQYLWWIDRPLGSVRLQG
jgi:putative ABC transport system ATP-binding protein